MSKLEDQLKELTFKKQKVDYLKFLDEKIKNIKNIDFKEVEQEVKEIISSFIISKISLIEEGEVLKETTSRTTIPHQFDEESLKILAQIVEKAKGKVLPQATSVQKTETKVEKNVPVQDKITFALANRHLEGKILTANTLMGQVTGKVVGLDAPHIIIQTVPGSPAISITMDQIINKE